MDPAPPKNEYFLTPYYRTLTKAISETCEEEPTSTHSPYKIHCLNTRLIPLVPSYYLPVFSSIYTNDKMVMTVQFYDGDKRVVFSDEDHQKLQQAIDEITSVNAFECVIFTPRPLPDVPQWYQGWMLPAVRLETDVKLRLRENTIMGDLRPEGSEYTFPFDNLYLTLQAQVYKQLKDMYNQGYIRCSKNFAEANKLSYITTLKDYKDQNVWAPDWDIRAFTSTPVEYLVDLMTGVPYHK
jgi:hypothetical protein